MREKPRKNTWASQPGQAVGAEKRARVKRPEREAWKGGGASRETFKNNPKEIQRKGKDGRRTHGDGKGTEPGWVRCGIVHLEST